MTNSYLEIYSDFVVIVNPIDNSPMIWINSEFSQNNLPSPNHQKKQKMNSLEYILKQGKNVLDAGAHIGDFGLCLACALKNKNRDDIIVYCIEPSKIKCEFMKKICELNNIKNNVRILNIGLSEKYKKYDLQENQTEIWKNNTGAWKYVEKSDGIDFMSLDMLYKANIIENIGFFWCDCEGFEFEILNGGINFLNYSKPYILMEYNVERLSNDNKYIQIKPGTKTDLLNNNDFNCLCSKINIEIINTEDKFDDILLKIL